MSRRSRYKDAKYFSAEPGLPAPFPGIRPRDIGPATGIVEYKLKQWDRLDRLSFHYYNDVDLWWRILDANPEVLCAVDLSIDPKTQEGSKQETVEKTLLIPGASE
ncbi:MAG: hypothetical protein LBP94_07400 [Zoogloeaceae bacterium]|jgi:hypothetical protein|nr:hypothetical protein [Zoogloeaceae bacterium]